MIIRRIKAQTLMEYLIIIGVVMTAVFIMAPSMKRSTQSIIKITADQLGTQKDSEQDFSVTHMVNSVSNAKVDNRRLTNDTLDGLRTVSNETTNSFTNTITY